MFKVIGRYWCDQSIRQKKKSLPRLVMAPLGQEFDDNIAGLEDKPENNSNDDTGEFKRFYLQLRR